MLGQKQDLIITTTGHDATPFGERQVLEIRTINDINVIINLKTSKK